MPTNANMVAIQTVTVTSASTPFIEFTSIPQTYTDLYIKASLRGTGNSTLFIRPNNDTGSNYYTAGAYADNTGQDAFVSTYNYAHGGEMQYATLTANTFSTHEIYISNYAASQRHPIMTQDVQAASTANVYLFMTQTLYNVASPITSVRLVPNTGSITQYSSVTLYGVKSAAVAAKATGGIVTADSDYFYHTFLSSGIFTPTQNLTADYLVVAGGGGGGTNIGGGGGGGGMRCTVGGTGGSGSLESPLSLTANTAYTVTIGAGGAAGYYSAGTPNNGGDGSNSVFSTITSTGGGGGDGNNNNGRAGGSGGGGDRQSTGGAASPSGQGFAGGNGASGELTSGGGGGAGAVGNNASYAGGGNGGNGRATSISGASVAYAGGGGGCAYNSGDIKGTGGIGGGGDGTNTSRSSGSNGSANFGGGGGGWSCVDAGGSVGLTGFAGGSGIVIVRYAK